MKCLKLGTKWDFTASILTVTLLHPFDSAFHVCMAEWISSWSNEGRANSLQVPSLTHLLVKISLVTVHMQRNVTKRKTEHRSESATTTCVLRTVWMLSAGQCRQMGKYSGKCDDVWIFYILLRHLIVSIKSMHLLCCLSKSRVTCLRMQPERAPPKVMPLSRNMQHFIFYHPAKVWCRLVQKHRSD